MNLVKNHRHKNHRLNNNLVKPATVATRQETAGPHLQICVIEEICSNTFKFQTEVDFKESRAHKHAESCLH